MESGHGRRSRATADAKAHASPTRPRAPRELADGTRDLQHAAGNAAMTELLGRAPDDPRPIQRYQGPDSGWWDKLGSDAVETGFEGLEALPGVGNIGSAFSAGGMLASAGYDAITGDSKSTKADLEGAENFGLNAIPILGNLRAAGQTLNGVSTVAGDLESDDPSKNKSSWDSWGGGGAQKVNQGVSDIFSNLI